MSPPKQAWSYSRLRAFRECPLKCYWQNYAPKGQRLKFVQNAAMRRGESLHKQMELGALAHRAGKPVDFARYDPSVVTTLTKLLPLIAKADDIFVEQDWAFTSAWTPGDWYDTSGVTWFRQKIDLGLIFGDECYIFDYKSGRINDTPEQLELSALSTFYRRTRINTVHAYFMWLDHDKKSKRRTYTRDPFQEELDAKYRGEAGLIDRVAESGEWIAKPGNCKWCGCSAAQCVEKR